MLAYGAWLEIVSTIMEGIKKITDLQNKYGSSYDYRYAIEWGESDKIRTLAVRHVRPQAMDLHS